MNEEKLKQLFQQAETELKNARRELYKPSEDVVTYSVCVFSRSALYHFMSCLYILYALDNDDTVEGNRTLGQLIDYCTRYDNTLQQIDFNAVQCKDQDVLNKEEVFYCNDVPKVNYCTDLAEKTRELVLAKAASSLPSEVSFP